MGKPTHRCVNPSFLIVLVIASKIFLYGNVPSAFCFIFWIFVFALSKGKLEKEERNPDIKLALRLKNSLLKTDWHCFLFFWHIVHKSFFYFIIWWKHCQVQYTGSDYGRCCSSPKGHHSFLFSNSLKSINNIVVISSLCKWKTSISLHSYKSQISWISHKWADKTGKNSRIRFLEKCHIFFIEYRLYFGQWLCFILWFFQSLFYRFLTWL